MPPDSDFAVAHSHGCPMGRSWTAHGQLMGRSWASYGHLMGSLCAAYAQPNLDRIAKLTVAIQAYPKTRLFNAHLNSSQTYFEFSRHLLPLSIYYSKRTQLLHEPLCLLLLPFQPLQALLHRLCGLLKLFVGLLIFFRCSFELFYGRVVILW